MGHNGYMATMTVAEAKNHFSDVLRRAEYGGERVIVERHGKPVAAIVSTDDLRQLEAAENAVDLRDARAALAEANERGTIPLDAVLRKHGLSHLLVEQEPPVSRRPRARKSRPAVKRTRKPSRRQRQR
jgi:prevent-host-death family protein